MLDGIERIFCVKNTSLSIKSTKLHLYKVSVAIEGKSVYSESVGVAIYDSEEKKVVRGAELLKLVADSLSPEHLVSAANEYEPSEAHKYLGERA
ncbi:MAG: hypothetical protein ACP5GN_07560, partial [Fervidicoccaceae archaeon]